MTRRRHGTVYGLPHWEGRKVCAATYNSGCHCDGCREAKRVAQDEVIARRAAVAAAGHPSGTSVSEATYRDWRCRCDGCRAAHAVVTAGPAKRRAQRAWRARKIAGTVGGTPSPSVGPRTVAPSSSPTGDARPRSVELAVPHAPQLPAGGNRRTVPS